jgi:hypothetical protein
MHAQRTRTHAHIPLCNHCESAAYLLCIHCAFTSHSLRIHCAFTAQSVHNRIAITAQLCAIAAKSPRNFLRITMHSPWRRCTTGAKSLRNHCIIDFWLHTHTANLLNNSPFPHFLLLPSSTHTKSTWISRKLKKNPAYDSCGRRYYFIPIRWYSVFFFWI